MRVTQADIARAAEVSQATVSRVLAGDARVETSIRDRVLAAVAAHNYQPDARARSLRSKTVGLVGLVIERPAGGLADDPFFTALLSEVTDVLADTPYRLCLEVVRGPGRQRQVYDELLRSRRVDGILLVESEAHDRRLQMLQADSFPFVLIGNPGGLPVWSVDNDNVYAAQLATQHLIDQGYQRIAYLGGREGLTVSDDRALGYIRTMQAQARESRVIYADFGMEAARRATAEAMENPDAPDAFVVLDDFMGLGVLSELEALGIKAPDQVGVVAFNDSKLCRLKTPALSSVSLNLERMVRTAMTRLLAIIEGREKESPHREIIPCVLQARGSSQRLGGRLL